MKNNDAVISLGHQSHPKSILILTGSLESAQEVQKNIKDFGCLETFLDENGRVLSNSLEVEGLKINFKIDSNYNDQGKAKFINLTFKLQTVSLISCNLITYFYNRND